MSLLDDTAIFAAIVSQGGFSRAAKYLGLSNGLISRRIAKLEKQLGVTLIVRTTRQIHLTKEGELFWQHAQRIQQELDSALSLIQGLSAKPKGEIRVSAPVSFGVNCLTPIIIKFMKTFDDIYINLILTNQRLDPIKDNLDLIIRGIGYLENRDQPKDSNLIMKLLKRDKISLYASPEYLVKNGEPQSADDLLKHTMIGYVDNIHLPNEETWIYTYKNKKNHITLKPKFKCNNIESSVNACSQGFGIARYSELPVKFALEQKTIQPVLKQYDWGMVQLYAVYAQQQALPKRTRLL